uniref:Uncharacterized protein n=1 Tax=Oryza brachyantha TaxID=4533 RepID=J3KX12_ORYBR
MSIIAWSIVHIQCLFIFVLCCVHLSVIILLSWPFILEQTNGVTELYMDKFTVTSTYVFFRKFVLITVSFTRIM